MITFRSSAFETSHLMLVPVMVVAAILVFFTGPSSAKKIINKDLNGVAIKGYDPVAYFTVGKAVKGKSQIRYSWKGASWWFSSAANRDKFVADPERYAPQYGGFCASAMVTGKFIDINPKVWKIVGGKLYLSYNLKYFEAFKRNLSVNIKRADRNWAEISK